jgi:3-deoxy-manno-octulosonate cytidylyltransferase (CMP-KDO synthetase)
MTTGGASPRGGCLRSQIIIPARLASTRLPRKLLLRETGKTVLQHTYESARRARRPAGICVAADHEEIADEVRRFGGPVFLTDPAAASGTDRVAEVARQMPDVDIVVNVQGDEPLIDPLMIEAAVRPLLADPSIPMGTLKTPLTSLEEFRNPNVVKVVTDRQGFALYFSRAPIPHPRDFVDQLESRWRELACAKHVGLYVYRRDFLLAFPQLKPTPLEEQEKLEQLRALEHGHRIFVAETALSVQGVDTPEDLERVRQLLLASHASLLT